MIKIGHIYTHEDSPLTITVVQITYEGPTHYRVLGIARIKDTGHKFEGLKEFNLDKATLEDPKWTELPRDLYY